MCGIAFNSLDGKTLAGLLVQSGGNPTDQRKILDVFTRNKEMREDVPTETWWYVFNSLPKDLKNRIRPFLEGRGQKVPLAA